MTEESSADEDERDADERPDQQRADEERPGDTENGSEDGLAPARSEEEPDVEAAKAELEAVGGTDDVDETSEQADPDPGEPEASDAPSPTDAEREPASLDDAADDAGAADATEDEGGAGETDADPNPEDLVRDPGEPQVMSSLDEEEAADTEPDAPEAESTAETEAPDAAATADGDATGAESNAIDADADSREDPTDGPDTPAVPDAESGDETDAGPDDETGAESDEQPDHQPGVPEDVQKYDRFKKVDGSQYDRVNEFLRDRTYITAREWAIARLCSDFRTETGVEMTKIGENLPELVPFMTDTYTPQAVNQARSSFEDKVRTAGATFLYGAMCDFFTAEELDDVMYESTEVAKFLLEVEGVELSVEDELEAEDRISAVMREVRSSSAELRHERCPDCGAELSGGEK